MGPVARVLQCCPGCARQYEVAALAAESPLVCSCGVTFSVTRKSALAPRAMCCSSCGGNLKADALACEYCQAEITIEERQLDSICPACFARMSSDADFCMSCGVKIDVQVLAALPSNAACPRCRVVLRSRRVGAETLIECPSCAGLWVEPQLLERLCNDAGAAKSVCESLGAMAQRAAGAAKNVLAYIPCPNCKQPMNRKNFGSISGILIDVCKEHGVWLDHGELERALAFAGKGGLVEARRREVGELERRQQRAMLDAPAAGDAWLDKPVEFGSGRSNHGGVIEWFVRQLFN